MVIKSRNCKQGKGLGKVGKLGGVGEALSDRMKLKDRKSVV